MQGIHVTSYFTNVVTQFGEAPVHVLAQLPGAHHCEGSDCRADCHHGHDDADRFCVHFLASSFRRLNDLCHRRGDNLLDPIS